MAKPITFEDKYYVYVPTAFFKLSREEWKDFETRLGPKEMFRDQRDLVYAIKKWRNEKDAVG